MRTIHMAFPNLERLELTDDRICSERGPDGITDRFNYSTAMQKTVAAFKVAPALLHDDAAIEARVTEALASLSWDAMRTQARYNGVSLVIV